MKCRPTSLHTPVPTIGTVATLRCALMLTINLRDPMQRPATNTKCICHKTAGIGAGIRKEPT
jgi:hypothetical protein